MTSTASVRLLLAFVAAIPDNVCVTLWSGIPCTGGSPLQIMNKRNPSYKGKMKAHLKLWNRLFSNMLVVAQAIVRRGGHLILEWPERCLYWKHPKVLALLSRTTLSWTSMIVRACAHGQIVDSGKYAGMATTKSWRMCTTMYGLDDHLALPCPGNHQHITTEGSNIVAMSGKYLVWLRPFISFIPNHILSKTPHIEVPS